MGIFTFVSGLVVVTNLCLFFLISFSNNRGRVFSISLLGASIWSSSILFLQLLPNFYKLYLIRVSFWGAILTVVGFYLFEREYIRNEKTKYRYLFSVLALLLITFLFSDFIVESISNIQPVKISYGIGYPLFGILFFGTLLLTTSRVVRTLISSRKKKLKQQLKYFVTGISISFLIGGFTNLVYPILFNSSDLSNYGPLGLIFFAGFGTYGILKHKLFDIKMIVSQILVAMVGILLFVYIFLSESTYEYILNIFIFIIFLFVSKLLLREIFAAGKREEEIKKANQQLKDIIDTKDIFLRMTSHQLRTPLTSLNGFLGMILDQWRGHYKMNKTARKFLLSVFINAQRLGTIVGDVLAVSAIESGRFGVSIRDTMDVKQEIEYIISDKKYFTEYYGVKYKLTFKGENFEVMCDPVRLKEVFINMIHNGAFYGKSLMTIHVVDEGDEVEITFHDDGMGIRKEDIKKIWRAGWRSNDAKIQNPNGSGQGLFISREVLKLHKGTMDVESEGHKQGTTFTIRLPKK